MTVDTLPAMTPRNVESVSVMAPYGTKERLRRAAEAERVTVPELVRRAIDRAAAEALKGFARD